MQPITMVLFQQKQTQITHSLLLFLLHQQLGRSESVLDAQPSAA